MLTLIIPKECNLRMRSFEFIRISDPRSLGSWCIKGADESTLVKDVLVPLMNHGPCDIESLILIIPKKRIGSHPTADVFFLDFVFAISETVCLVLEFFQAKFYIFTINRRV